MINQLMAKFGQLQAATGPGEQFRRQMVFKRMQALGKRRLSDKQALRCFLQRAFFCNRHQMAQMPDVQQNITTSYISISIYHFFLSLGQRILSKEMGERRWKVQRSYSLLG